MRILVAHNFYRSSQPSGENLVAAEEAALLEGAGLEVIKFWRSSDDISWRSPRRGIDGALGSVVAPFALRQFQEVLERQRPDVVHLHHVLPLISPAVIVPAKRLGIPVVQTVHNYRHSCVNGMHVRNNETCTLCLGRRVGLPGIRYGCYRGSRAQSSIAVAGQALHRRTWATVDRFFALSHYHARRLLAAGLPEERVRVKPNSVPDPGSRPTAGRDVAFVGRLDETKGITALLDAWVRVSNRGDARLIVLGSGPEASRVEHMTRSNSSVVALGQVAHDAVAPHLDGCGLIVVPSTVEESFGRTVAEAMALSRAVVVTDRGAPQEMVTPDFADVCSPTVTGLRTALERCFAREDWQARGALARRHYENHYSPSTNVTRLIDTYEELSWARGA